MVGRPTGPGALSALFDPARAADPYPLYQSLREERAVWRLDDRLLVLSRHADCAAVLRDARFGHAAPEVGAARPRAGGGVTQRSLLGLDPPDHTRLRGLVAKAFTPRRVEDLVPRIEELATALIDAIPATGTFDLIAAVAAPLPVIIISELLGVPEADRPALEAWSHDLARGLEPDFFLPDGAREAQHRAREQFGTYLRHLIAERRAHPGPDLVSGLVAVHDERDALSEDEIVATCILLLIAGHETTTNLIGLGMRTLLGHPAELVRLRRHPHLLERAVEELLRFDSPVQLTGRTALTDADVDGTPVPQGTFVLSLVGAANRDPEAYDEPDRLDVARPPSRHLAFGQGIHFCLGAPLARVEAQIALRALTTRFGTLAMAGAPTWKETAVLRGLRALPLTAGADAGAVG